MTGKVGVRAQEEEVETRMQPTLNSRFTATNVTANQMTSIPTAAGVEGVTKKLCPRFVTGQGCPFGRGCQYDHPKDCPGA
eukprot:12915219-Prorocentrum_lima.AAC.1